MIFSKVYNISMNKFVLLFIILTFGNVTYADSINPYAYKTMTSQSYRNNYNRQVNYKPMPYWQAQSNYATRNRTYSSYSNYSNTQSNYYNRYYRGR